MLNPLPAAPPAQVASKGIPAAGAPIAQPGPRPEGDALALSAQPRDVSAFTPYLEDQNRLGSTNGCGTTTLGMIMSFWASQPGLYDRLRIDQRCRAGNNTTSIHRLRSYSREEGFRSQVQNQAQWVDLKRYLDFGVPVQVLIEPDTSKDWMLHYVNVIGYDTDAQGKPTALRIADPMGGKLVTQPYGAFMRQWSRLKLGGIDAGLNRVMLVHLPKDSRPVRGRDGIVRASSDFPLPPRSRLGLKAYLGHLVLESKNVLFRLRETLR